MAVLDVRGRRVVDSMLEAADVLERAHSGAAVRAAIRDVSLALEYRLDTLAQELAADPTRDGSIDPSMFGQATSVEMALKGMLVDCWALLRLGDVELSNREAALRFAARVRKAASMEIGLVFSQLTAPQGID